MFILETSTRDITLSKNKLAQTLKLIEGIFVIDLMMTYSPKAL